MADKKVYENTRPYYELFYAHKMQSLVLCDKHDLVLVAYSDLVDEGVEIMNQLESLNSNSDEHRWAFQDMIAIQNEQRRFHKSLCSEQKANGVEIMPSIDHVEYPF